MMKKEQQPQATGQKEEEEEEDQEEEQRKGKGAAMVETSAEVQRRHDGFLQRRREAQRQQHPRPFFLFGGRRPKEPDTNDDDPMVGTSLVVPSPRSSQPRETTTNGADAEDDEVDQNDVENPPPPAVVDQQQPSATTTTTQQQQQQQQQLVPGAYQCRNTMSTSIAMSSMSDLSESIQFFTTTTTTTAPNSHSSSSSSPHPLYLTPVVYNNNNSPLPHTNNVPEIILPTAVEVIEEENASFSLGNHHHNNKRRTQCLFAVMVVIICALAVALGVSLSGDSGNHKSGSSGGTALTSPPPPPDVEISVPSHQPDGGGGPAAGTAAGSINGTNHPAPVFVSVITGDNDNNNNNHDDNLIAGDFNSDFGESVSLCGDGSRVAVAAPNAGLVQVFDLPAGESGGTFRQVGQNITQQVSFEEWSGVVRTSIVVELSADCRVLAIGTPFAKVPQQQQQDGSDFNMNDSDPPDSGNNFMQRAGQVKLYRYDETLDSWEPLGVPHTIRGQADGQHAGAAISLSRDGGMLAVGFPGDDEWNNMEDGGAVGRNIGMVKVFRLSGEDWIQLGMPLYGRFDGQGFGGSVSLATLQGVGSHVVAIGSSTGATGNDNTVAADVFLFERGEWIRRGREIVPELESLVGKEMAWFVQLSANGRTLVISNLYVNSNGVAIRDDDNAGLYVVAFELVESPDRGDDDNNDDDNWVRIGNNIHQNKAGPKSGYIISLSQDGTRIGMGDPGTEDNGQGLKGHAHFYELVVSVDGQQKQWCQFGPDINGDAPGDMAGFAVSVSGNGKRMAIGYPKSRAKGLTHGIIRVFDIHDEGVVPNCDT